MRQVGSGSSGDRYGAAVVGLGYAGERHIQCYLQAEDAKIVGIADVDKDRLHAVAGRYGVKGTYTDFRRLVSRDDVDVVSVCTPNHLHAPVAVEALRSGKHVLCIKPLARFEAEARQIVSAAEASGCLLQVAFNHRQRDDVRVLKTSVDDGVLGKIYYANAKWTRRSGIPEGAGGWFASKDSAGGGPLIDLGVHLIDAILYLLGEPRAITVSAGVSSLLTRRSLDGDPRSGDGVEDLGTAFVRFSDGTLLWMETSWALHGGADDDFALSLYGTRGGAEIKMHDYAWRDTLRIYTDVAGEAAEVRPRLREGKGHAGVVRGFLDAVERGERTHHTGRLALERVRIIDACYASARDGREVVLGDPVKQASLDQATVEGHRDDG